MSGGSHSYLCYRIEEEYVSKMHDKELDDLMRDIAQLTHDLEWYDSGDYGIEDYQKSIKNFKEKWFEQNREERLKGYIDEAVDDLREELHSMIGGKKE